MNQDECSTLRNSSIIAERRGLEPQFGWQRGIELVQISLSLFQQFTRIEHVGPDKYLRHLIGDGKDLDQVMEGVGQAATR